MRKCIGIVRSQPQPGDPCHPVTSGGHAPAVAFNIHSANCEAMRGSGPSKAALETDVARALDATNLTQGQGGTCVATPMAVRRLTPAECERLMGFPDAWTAIAYRGKPASDSPRYRALGNSMAVPCVRWIGTRLDLFRESCV